MSKTFGCVGNGNTIRLLSGRYLDLANPHPDQFTLADVAGALSKICRFGGQIERFYSVAEHCYWCSKIAEEDGLPIDTQVACLMHDAAEAFVGDCVKPLKNMLAGYKEIEYRIETAIAEKWLIDFERESISVEGIDHAMLIAERRRLFSPDQVEWAGESSVRVIHPPIRGWEPMAAEAAFVSRAYQLGIK